MSDKENAVQQAQIWAQEARAQRAIVRSILRYFGLPERDYEALTLIQGRMKALKQEVADLGYHHSASHITPDYRDGFNRAIEEACGLLDDAGSGDTPEGGA